MTPRTRILLIAMGAVGLLWLADTGYRTLVEGPVEERERQVVRLDQQINEARDQIIQSAKAPDTLEYLERLSLPYDPELARAGYQDWLLDLIQRSNLTGASVDAGDPTAVKLKDPQTGKPKEVYLRYVFSLRGRGSLQQIVDFMHQFYQGGHLHKITAFSMNPVSQGRLIDFTASIEAIGLTRCEREGELSRELVSRLASSDFHDYQSIARRNLFARHGDATLAKVVVTAITVAAGGIPEVWISRDGGQTEVCTRGRTIEIDAHSIEVVDILQDRALLDVDGRVLAIRAGQSIQEADR